MSNTGAPLYLELLAVDGERRPEVKFNQNMRIINNMLFASGSTLYTGLQAFWKLDEASGTRVDEWGDNDLTDVNTVTGAVGKIGNACQFTAANSERLSIVDNAALSMGDFDFSLAGWVYLDSVGVQRGIAGKYTTVLEYQVYINTSNQIVFYVSSDGVGSTVVTNTATALSVSTWYFVCAWHDSVANTINVSVNNGTAASVAHTTGVRNGSDPFTLGSEGLALYWNGRLDAWGVWKKALSASERTTLYNGGAGLETPFS